MPRIRHIESDTWLDCPDEIFKQGSLAINNFADQHVRAIAEATAEAERQAARKELEKIEAEKTAVAEADDLRALVMQQSAQIAELQQMLNTGAPDRALEAAMNLQAAVAAASGLKAGIFNDLEHLEKYRRENAGDIEALKKKQAVELTPQQELAKLNRLMFARLRAGTISQQDFDEYIKNTARDETAGLLSD